MITVAVKKSSTRRVRNIRLGARVRLFFIGISISLVERRIVERGQCPPRRTLAGSWSRTLHERAAHCACQFFANFRTAYFVVLRAGVYSRKQLAAMSETFARPEVVRQQIPQDVIPPPSPSPAPPSPQLDNNLTISTKISTDQLICKTPQDSPMNSLAKTKRKIQDDPAFEKNAKKISEVDTIETNCYNVLLYLALMQIFLGLLMCTFGVLVIMNEASLAQVIKHEIKWKTRKQKVFLSIYRWNEWTFSFSLFWLVNWRVYGARGWNSVLTLRCCPDSGARKI